LGARRVTRLIFVFLVACGGVATSTTKTVEPPVAQELPKHEADYAALQKTLATSKLAGFALVDHGKLSQTETDAKVPHGVRGYVAIVEDRGAVVRVRTNVAKVHLAEVDESYDVEAFVARAALSPVLAHPIIKEGKDGSGVVLREGLEVVLGPKSIVPHEKWLVSFPVAIAPSDVALSFAIAEPNAALSRPSAPAVGCLRTKSGIHVGAPADLVNEAQAEWRAANPTKSRMDFDLETGGYRHATFPCSLAEDAPLSVLGIATTKQRYVESEVTLATRAGEGRVLVTMDLERATVRASASDGALGSGGGGRGGLGSLGGSQRPRIWQASGEIPAYFPDGTRAGTHVGRATKLRGGKEVAGRICVDRMFLAVQICHDKKDLEEVEDNGF
jgi:hypothetical protein